MNCTTERVHFDIVSHLTMCGQYIFQDASCWLCARPNCSQWNANPNDITIQYRQTESLSLVGGGVLEEHKSCALPVVLGNKTQNE